MSTWLVPRSDLTPEQLRAVELDPSEHRLIFGGPGSGKTQILLHRARYLCDRYSVGPDRVRIFVYTNVLKDYIRSALDLLRLPESCVSTFDFWVVDFYEKSINPELPRNAYGRPDFAFIRQEVLQTLTRRPTSPVFDYVLVDEGQDLDSTSFELLRLTSRHLTVCIDHKQRIYDSGSAESEILQRLGLRRRNSSLLAAFRCCPFVVKLAAEYITDSVEKEAYIKQARTAQTERETPLLYTAKDFEDERRRLVEIVRIRLAKGERIAILLPLNRQVYGFAQGLRRDGIEVDTQNELDFTTDQPKILTYHSAKGLTFDTVLLPRLLPRSFTWLSEETIERLLFVAISRATKWVYLSTTAEANFGPLQRLFNDQQREFLTLQKFSSGPAPQQKAATTSMSGDDLLDLL